MPSEPSRESCKALSSGLSTTRVLVGDDISSSFTSLTTCDDPIERAERSDCARILEAHSCATLYKEYLHLRELADLSFELSASLNVGYALCVYLRVHVHNILPPVILHEVQQIAQRNAERT
jgi:hypothetical protein